MRNLYKALGLCTFLCGGSMLAYAQDSDWSEGPQELLPELMKQQQDVSVFTRLLQETGWDQELLAFEDAHYVPQIHIPENPHAREAFVPETRKIAFTVFAEHDTVFASRGITDAASLTRYLKEHYVFDRYDLLFDGQYTDPHHVVNQFVSYHLLPQKLLPSQLVVHYNELDFNLRDFVTTGVAVPTVPVYDYYETMGFPRRLLKVYESPESGGVRLNRFVRFGEENFVETKLIDEGLPVSKEHCHEAKNGYVYLLNGMMVYDDRLSTYLSGERIRVDMATLSPELMNQGYRRPLHKYLVYGQHKTSVYLMPDFQENIKVLAGNLFYLPGPFATDLWWADYQGDEFLLFGDGGADIIIKLPPVPKAGAYQIRTGLNSNDFRSDVQYYLAEDDHWLPLGLPVSEAVRWDKGYASYGWNNESFVDPDIILRNSGLLKGPASCKDSPFVAQNRSLRENPAAVRRILTTVYLEPDKTYHLRIKSLCKEKDIQVFMDYLELVPSSVYNNPVTAEDIW